MYNTVKVADIAHLFGMTPKYAVRVANEQGLPIKAFKLGGKRAPWLDCSKRKWCVDSTTGYAVAKIERRKQGFHRYILQAPKGMLIDHINRDRLDNRICNLRFVTYSQNSQNRTKLEGATSKYIGVTWDASKTLWKCALKLHGTYYHIGYFEDEIDAAEAYNKRAIEAFGPEAALNEL